MRAFREPGAAPDFTPDESDRDTTPGGCLGGLGALFLSAAAAGFVGYHVIAFVVGLIP